MIQYFNRVTKKIETETVYGGSYVEWAYQNKLGFALTEHFLSKKWLSLLMGAYENSSFSRNKIESFIEAYDIDMSLYEEAQYSSFNEFFIRKFKKTKREFDEHSGTFSAGAEARYLGFENVRNERKLKVKGIEIDLQELFRDHELAAEFDGGTVIIARLCPVDYHRYHFPITGQVTRAYTVHGELHSVNPVALKAKPDIFLVNERQIAILENEKFGKVAMIEVGALGVGKIIQSAYSENGQFPVKFDKGQEKGYFLFGGSTVIWVLQKGKAKLSADLLQNSRHELETWIPLGDTLASESNDESGGTLTAT
jgi:phosphatidylserine decarboxylase